MAFFIFIGLAFMIGYPMARLLLVSLFLSTLVGCPGGRNKGINQDKDRPTIPTVMTKNPT